MPDLTPVYGLPYPNDADTLKASTKDTPKALALAVESTVAALTGAPAPTAWTAPVLSGTWVNFGGTFAPAGYRKVAGVVYLRGVVRLGADGSTIFTLPVGFRPPVVGAGGDLLMPTVSNVAGGLDVTTAGIVRHRAGTGTTFVSLDGIRFLIT